MMTAKGEALVRGGTAVGSIGWRHFCKLLLSWVGLPKHSNWEGGCARVVQVGCAWGCAGVVRSKFASRPNLGAGTQVWRQHLESIVLFTNLA